MKSLEEQSNRDNIELKKLEHDFTSLLSQFNTDSKKIKDIFSKLVNVYSSEGRHYHNVCHIQAMLAFLEQHQENIKSFQTLFLATWYHDAIYDSKSQSNERDSAEMMKKDMSFLGLPEDIIHSIYGLILATQRHEQKIQDTDESLFLDADLSILSSSEHVYATYSANIRKEYSWVSEEEYKKGRRGVLHHFLQRDTIYFSDVMTANDLIARKNIEHEISQLN